MVKANPGGRIRGRVVSGDRPLADVRCSDGRRVVATDRDGRFVIDAGAESGPFVFVVIPRGYWTERFYVPTAEARAREVVFDLEPTGPADRYSAVYIADIHLGEGNREVSYERFSATVDELNRMASRPAFVLADGDICLQSGQGERYVEIMSKLKMPVRNGVGNHEIMVSAANPRGRFHELFGPTYYSFDYGRVHYVVMDGCVIDPEGEGYKNVVGEVGPTELAWLEEDLRLVPEDVPTVVAIHIPLVSTYPERRKTTAKAAPWWVVRNADEVIELFRKFDVRLVLQGHMHENERIHDGAIEFVESVSVCGSWWRSKTGRELAVSGEPRGYRLIEVESGRVSHRYVASAESRVADPGELVGVEDDRLVAGADLVVNFFDASNEAKVRGRIDGGAWMPWAPAKVPGRLADLTAAHHWRCPADRLAAGRHKVEVRCEDRGRPDVTLVRQLRIG